MVPNPFINVSMKTGESAQVDCPVEGKGFSSITLRTNSSTSAAAISTSKISGDTDHNFFAFSGTPTHFRFNGGDNTVPKTLYFRNLTNGNTFVCIFIEEVGSNPV